MKQWTVVKNVGFFDLKLEEYELFDNKILKEIQKQLLNKWW